MAESAGSKPKHAVDQPVSGWQSATIGGMTIWWSRLLTAVGVAHAFTARPDNMSISHGPDPDRSRQRRAVLCEALGGQTARLTSMEQVHGNRVVAVDDPLVGQRVLGADGLVGDLAGLPLLARSADCPLVIVADPQAAVAGVAHAGWRGTVAGITRRLVERLVAYYGVRPAELVAAIAPSAGPCCYRVGPEVVDAAVRALGEDPRLFVHRDGSVCFDLWTANVQQLVAAGVDPDRIDLAGLCTICDDRFFSYRRQGPTTGHAGLLVLVPPARM